MTEPENGGRRRDPLDVLLEEYLAKCRRGDAVPIEELVERGAKAYPEDAARIRELLPQLAPLQVLLESVSPEPGIDAPLLQPGQRIRHYRIERRLGRGGMGEVYLAQNTMLGSFVAIKLLSSKFSNDPQLSAAFEREARMAAHLDHPHIATVHDFFQVDERHYLVMEYVEGRSLGDLLKTEKPVPLAKLLDLAVQIAEGLAAAHGRGIIHRDLKPDNVMIKRDGRVKILDFGLAKVDQAESPDSSRLGTSIFDSGAVIGTVGYMSPEQLRGQPVDARTDLFALGAVLYEMATGTTPFRKATFADTQSALLNEQPASATTLNRDVPVELARLIDKLLAKRPPDRHQSCDAVLEDLKAIASPRAPRRRKRSKRVRTAFILLALAALVVLLAPDRTVDSPAIEGFTEQESEEFARLVREGEVLAAWKRLVELESKLGRPESTARALLTDKVDEQLREWSSQLWVRLAEGEALTEGEVGSIKDVDEIKKRLDADHVDASAVLREAVAEAARLEQGAKDRRARIVEHLDSNRLREAWEEISSLRQERLRGREFAPAAATADELRSRLVEAVESQLDAADDIDVFTRHLDLLREIEPQRHDRVAQEYANKRAQLQRDRQLEQLRDRERKVLGDADATDPWNVEDGDARSITSELARVHGQMLEMDPRGESAHTQAAKAALDRWNLAAATYDRFARASLDDVPEEFGDSEQDPVRAASEWLASRERVRGHVADDPAAARGALKDLAKASAGLAPRFRDAATALCGKLEAEIDAAEHEQRIRMALDLVARVGERIKKLRPPTATEREMLEGLEPFRRLPKVDEALRGLDRAVKDLERRRAEREKRDAEYEDLRRALRSPETLTRADVEKRLDDLAEGWAAEKRALDAAISCRPANDPSLAAFDEELLWSRALVNLRLRRYAEVLTDVSASGREQTAEGLLLSGVAEFGATRLDEAAANFKAVLAKTGSARAHYWLGTIANPNRDRRAGGWSPAATRHLEQASELDDGLADAHYQLAWLHYNRGIDPRDQQLLRQAIDRANRSLNAKGAFREDEMVTVFAGCDNAAYFDRARQLRCGVYLACARAYYHVGEYGSCIESCDSIVKVDDELAEAYYWRGASKHKLGDDRGARSDLDRAIEKAPNSPDGAAIKADAQRIKRLIGSGER